MYIHIAIGLIFSLMIIECVARLITFTVSFDSNILKVYGTSKVANIWFVFGMNFWANFFFSLSLSSSSLIPQPASLISAQFNHVINVKLT